LPNPKGAPRATRGARRRQTFAFTCPKLAWAASASGGAHLKIAGAPMGKSLGPENAALGARHAWCNRRPNIDAVV